MIPFWQIVLLSIIQGMAELLPVSSSAHVVVAEKLLHLQASSPDMAMLLVMLHTGTMFAVIVYYWKSWKRVYFSSRQATWRYLRLLALATAISGAVGLGLKHVLEKTLLHGSATNKVEIEQMFDHLEFIAPALAAVGVLILVAGLRRPIGATHDEIDARDSAAMGIVQGLALPFRGFSRSGGTISLGLLLGAARRRAEEFSFAMAVIITPAVIGWEARRLISHRAESGQALHLGMFAPSLLGMVCAFLAGLVALKWLSRWLERGQWYVFGIYCLAAAAAVTAMKLRGY